MTIDQTSLTLINGEITLEHDHRNREVELLKAISFHGAFVLPILNSVTCGPGTDPQRRHGERLLAGGAKNTSAPGSILIVIACDLTATGL